MKPPSRFYRETEMNKIDKHLEASLPLKNNYIQMKTIKNKVWLFMALLIFSAGELSAQVNPVTFNQIKGLQQKEKRLVLVLIGTEWCKYCHAMKQTILNDKKLAGTLKRSFYTVFLNAEDRSDIFFAGRGFKYKPTGFNTGVHQLAEELGTINGQVSFPSLCILNDKNEIIYQHSGFLKSSSMAILLGKLSLHQN